MAGRLAAWLAAFRAGWLTGMTGRPGWQVFHRIRFPAGSGIACLFRPAPPVVGGAAKLSQGHGAEMSTRGGCPVEIAPVGLPRSSHDFWQKLSGGRENQWPRNRNRLERVSGVSGRVEERTRRMGCRVAARESSQPGKRQRTKHTRKPSLTLQTISDKNRYSNRNFRTLRFD